MRLAGVLGEDAPDPRRQWTEAARRMPVPVYGLVPQRHLEDWGAIGSGSAIHDGVLDECHVSIGYTLWRNPDEPDDPVNLAELDEEQRRDLEMEPPWPRPAWLVALVQRMRYPGLGECVRTQWSRDPGRSGSAEAVLVAHLNHVLINQFRRTRAVGEAFPPELDSPVTERCVERGIPILVDGATRTGMRIDTDPDVAGLAVSLDAHTILTAAIPRDALPYLEIAFAVRPI